MRQLCPSAEKKILGKRLLITPRFEQNPAKKTWVRKGSKRRRAKKRSGSAGDLKKSTKGEVGRKVKKLRFGQDSEEQKKKAKANEAGVRQRPRRGGTSASRSPAPERATGPPKRAYPCGRRAEMPRGISIFL